MHGSYGDTLCECEEGGRGDKSRAQLHVKSISLFEQVLSLASLSPSPLAHGRSSVRTASHSLRAGGDNLNALYW